MPAGSEATDCNSCDGRFIWNEAPSESTAPTCATSIALNNCPTRRHWVHHDAHERVTQLLIDFFAPARQVDTAKPSTT